MLKPKSKLETLADVEGFASIEGFLSRAAADVICPGICTNKSCSYTCDVEPDQDAGWCEFCDANTVKSALVLAGVI